MIYYDIQHFGEDIEQVKWLCQLLKYPGNHLHISLDSPKRTIEEFKQWGKSNKRKDISVSKSPRSNWAGDSLSKIMMLSAERALKKKGWEYFVNLSGNCIPLAPQPKIIALLESYRSDDILSFCYCFNSKKEIEWINKDDVGIQCIYDHHRLTFFADKAVSIELDKGFDPVKFVPHRKAVFASETEEKNKFSIRGLTSSEIDKRRVDFVKNGHLVGRQWVIVNRKHLTDLVKNKDLRKSYLKVKNTFVSDESFWQIALFGGSNKIKNEISTNCLRYLNGERVFINSSNFKSIVNSEAIFARKFDMNKHSSLTKEIEKLVGL